MSKGELEGRIRDLERDNIELRQFHDRAGRQLDSARIALMEVFKLYQPFIDQHPKRDLDSADIRIAMRCKVCSTPEHHAWANDNYELWPCPTIRPFLDLTAFSKSDAPAESAEKKADDDV